MSFYLKDPGSRIDYAIDWGAFYLDGQVVAGSAWNVFPLETGGILLDGASFDLARTAVTLSGGLAGHVYSVTNRVTLSDGRVDERSITLRVEER
ncbi:MAG: hypothetical protein JWL74_1048 [Alphaproteobacteria bacterium]|nr:hypothetical protein [Alphaproteobacteria bacterium]